MRPYAYICLWEYAKKPKGERTGRNACWKLVECYGVDQDGYACTESKHASDDRHSFHPWMNKKVWRVKEGDKWVSKDKCPDSRRKDDFDWEPLMGRAVTVWSTESGATLREFHPPEWVPWLATGFFEKLCKLDCWAELVEDGYTLWAGTARAVEKLIYPE